MKFAARTPYYERLNIQKAESHYGAKYIGDFALRCPTGRWSAEPYAVFYNPTPKPQHGHYFGLTIRNNQVMITDASSIVNYPIVGIESGGEIVYSGWRRDYVSTPDGKASIDGGRDYTKVSGGRFVNLAIIDDELRIIDDELVDKYRIFHKLSEA